MSVERKISFAHISEFAPTEIGGIPSVLNTLDRFWKEKLEKNTIFYPGERDEDISSPPDVVPISKERKYHFLRRRDITPILEFLEAHQSKLLLHHPRRLGLETFFSLQNKLRQDTVILWYGFVNLKHFITQNKPDWKRAVTFYMGILARRKMANTEGVINIALSNTSARSLEQIGIKEEKILVCHFPTGISPTPVQLERKVPKKYKNRDEFLILCVSRLVPEKGIDQIIRLGEHIGHMVEQKSIETTAKKFRVAVVGGPVGGPYFETLKECAQAISRKNANVSVDFVGPYFGKDLGDWYYSADVFFNPSKMETWGFTTIEAMRFGLPIIAIDCEGTQEVFEFTKKPIGYLVPAGAVAEESKQEAKFIVKLASTPLLQEEYRKNCLTEAKQFDPSSQAARLLGVLTQK